MKEPFFTGTCTALVTPFLDGKVNYPMMEQLLRRQMDSGIHAVVLAGTTGEGATLTDTEKLEMVRRAKNYVADRCKIIAGTGSNDTAHAVALSRAAQEVGADALLVVTPYYNKATPDGLYAHYAAIASQVDVPVILYNVPSRTGVDLPVSVCQRLSRLSNIAGLKEASADMGKVAQLLWTCGEALPVWSGSDELTLPAMALGASGVISVTSNVFPKETADMVNAALSGDFASAAAIGRMLYPLTRLLFCEVNPIPVKAALAAIGFDCGGCRLPLTRLSEEHAARLHKFLKGFPPAALTMNVN